MHATRLLYILLLDICAHIYLFFPKMWLEFGLSNLSLRDKQKLLIKKLFTKNVIFHSACLSPSWINV